MGLIVPNSTLVFFFRPHWEHEHVTSCLCFSPPIRRPDHYNLPFLPCLHLDCSDIISRDSDSLPVPFGLDSIASEGGAASGRVETLSPSFAPHILLIGPFIGFGRPLFTFSVLERGSWLFFFPLTLRLGNAICPQLLILLCR